MLLLYLLFSLCILAACTPESDLSGGDGLLVVAQNDINHYICQGGSFVCYCHIRRST